jgi:hypothetical protein
MEKLESYGFDSYVLEDLSFYEQVDLFSSAEIVVGPHGAGFTNTIFADDLTLLELFGSGELSHSLCYYGSPARKDSTTPLSEYPSKETDSGLIRVRSPRS